MVVLTCIPPKTLSTGKHCFAASRKYTIENLVHISHCLLLMVLQNKICNRTTYIHSKLHWIDIIVKTKIHYHNVVCTLDLVIFIKLLEIHRDYITLWVYHCKFENKMLCCIYLPFNGHN